MERGIPCRIDLSAVRECASHNSSGETESNRFVFVGGGVAKSKDRREGNLDDKPR